MPARLTVQGRLSSLHVWWQEEQCVLYHADLGLTCQADALDEYILRVLGSEPMERAALVSFLSDCFDVVDHDVLERVSHSLNHLLRLGLIEENG